MNTFEQSLLRGIPLAEAADFFLRVRGKDKVAAPTHQGLGTAFEALSDDDQRVVAKEVVANMMGAAGAGGGMAPAALPATGKGMNMPATPATALPPTAQGMNSVKLSSDAHEVGKGRAEAATAAHFEKEKHHQHEHNREFIGRLGGALAGGAAGHRYGKGNPVSTLGGIALGAHLGAKAGKHSGTAADRSDWEKKHAEAFKAALDAMGIQPQLDPATQQYLAQEQMANTVAEQSEAAYLRQVLEQTRAEAQQAQQQAQQLQQAQALHEQELSQIQGQVADSTQKSMAAADQVLKEQQGAAAIRMAYQQLRGNILQLASTDPPLSGSDAALAAASTAAGPTSAPSPQSGPAGQAPNPGTPVTVAPEGDDQVSRPVQPNEPMFGNAEGTTQMGQKEPGGDAKIPNKEVLSSVSRLRDGLKLASLGDYLSNQVSSLRSVLPHAAIGAGLGAAAGAGEAFTSNESLRQKVQELEGKPDRGFGDTANLAQSKARLTMGDFASKHPGATMGMGALGGALMGATQGPEAVASLRRSVGHVGEIAKNLKGAA